LQLSKNVAVFAYAEGMMHGRRRPAAFFPGKPLALFGIAL
jgi:hypothetical protein